MAVKTKALIPLLLESLDDAIPCTAWRSSKDENDKAFAKKMFSQGAGRYFPLGFPLAWAAIPNPVSESLTESLDLVQSSSLLQDAMKDIPRSSMDRYYFICKNEHGKKQIFARKVFESLLAAGLNLDANDYVIIDPEKEPALQRLLR